MKEWMSDCVCVVCSNLFKAELSGLKKRKVRPGDPSLPNGQREGCSPTSSSSPTASNSLLVTRKLGNKPQKIGGREWSIFTIN